MRSRGSVVAFLLLASPHVLGATRRSSSLAPKTVWSHLLAALTAQRWLEPGLIFAGILLLLLIFFYPRRSAESRDERPVHRVFRAPDLSRFHGIAPRRHRDLEA